MIASFARLCALVSLLATLAAPSAFAAELRLDCSRTTGRIRPLHGGNCGPLQRGGLLDLSAYHRQLRIPFTRLHDCHWPDPDIVDIHAIFPNFAADPENPASYTFERTDEYINAIVQAGSGIVYRLGESIEHTNKKYHVHPPADPRKWADICLGIIRHYNDAWANGFRHNIRYWEIWNEPENRPAMWTGSDEQFFQLYEAAAKAIKARYPALKVGGPSLGHTGAIVNGQFEASAFAVRFLDHCRQNALPLDFFSFHLYTNDPAECATRAKGIRQLLDQKGFTHTELHFNEWNYLPDNDWTPMSLQGQGKPRERFYDRIGNAEGAAFAAAVLSNLQDTPIDVANYYMFDNQGFGLFTTHGVPRKSFHALKAFTLLLDTPLRLPATGHDPRRLTICAGINSDRSQIRILIANFASPDPAIRLTLDHLPWPGPTAATLLTLDADHDLTPTPLPIPPSGAINLNLPSPSTALLTLYPAATSP